MTGETGKADTYVEKREVAAVPAPAHMPVAHVVDVGHGRVHIRRRDAKIAEGAWRAGVSTSRPRAW